MCKPAPKATAGAVLMNAICTKAGLATVGAGGSGLALWLVAGTALNAWVILGLVGTNAITGIVLLVKRANRPEPFAGAPAAARMPARTTIRLEARTVPAITQATHPVHEITHISAPTTAA